MVPKSENLWNLSGVNFCFFPLFSYGFVLKLEPPTTEGEADLGSEPKLVDCL